MGVENNYQLDLIKYEDDYKDKLLIIIGFLFENINTNKNYNKKEINDIFTDWQFEHASEVKSINEELNNKLTNYAKKIYKELDKDNDNIEFKKKDNTKLINNFNNNLIEEVANKLNKIELNYKLNKNLDNKEQAIDDLITAIDNNVQKLSTYLCKNIVFNNLIEQAIANNKKYYLWVTQGDIKVRDTHKAMDNHWVDINSAPRITNYFHVGQDYNCRCYIGAFA